MDVEILPASEDMRMIRSPMVINDQVQVYIYNSAIDTSDQQLVVYQNHGMLDGGPGYCVVYNRAHIFDNNPPNYRDTTKRSNLNECITQLYLMYGQGDKVHWEPYNPDASQEELWHEVEFCLQPSIMTHEEAWLERVKRKLFFRDRPSRKRPSPARGSCWGATKLFHFRAVRHHIVRPQQMRRRNILHDARQNVLQQLIFERLRHELITDPTGGTVTMNANVVSDISSYHISLGLHLTAIEVAAHGAVGELAHLIYQETQLREESITAEG